MEKEKKSDKTIEIYTYVSTIPIQKNKESI